ncbi:MAG TPA: hypothetical protein PKH95_00660 [Candidatus Magasanikbacteria bacterium]|nr:hypothetical protein [Candidatus Magasanikbacteria bacterium]
MLKSTVQIFLPVLYFKPKEIIMKRKGRWYLIYYNTFPGESYLSEDETEETRILLKGVTNEEEAIATARAKWNEIVKEVNKRPASSVEDVPYSPRVSYLVFPGFRRIKKKKPV